MQHYTRQKARKHPVLAGFFVVEARGEPGTLRIESLSVNRTVEAGEVIWVRG